MDIWLRTNEVEEALIALAITCDNLPRVAEEPHYWPWVIVPLHNAFQGFMVLALRGSNSLNVLTKESAAKWMAAHVSGSGDYTLPKLDRFLNLYKKTKSDAMRVYGTSKAFKPTGSQGRSIKKLNALRNEFVHFVPKGWSLEVTGLPRIVVDCVEAMEFFAFESGNVLWVETASEDSARSLMTKAREEARKLSLLYGA